MVNSASTETLAMTNSGDLEKAERMEPYVQPIAIDEEGRMEQEPHNSPTSPVKLFDKYLVELDPKESPYHLPLFRKVTIVLVVSIGALCSTFASSIVCQQTPSIDSAADI